MQNKLVKTKTAVVVSKSGDKSIKVGIEYKVKHQKYGKYIKKRTTLSVHDQHNQACVGDMVQVAECKPYSKTKGWRLVRILKTAAVN